MTRPEPSLIVCFAVEAEAAPFRRVCRAVPQLRILRTGMGRQNAARTLRAALPSTGAALVVTSGFAGGLNPGLPGGTVVFEADPVPGLEACLLATGAQAARFHTLDRVLTTATEKRVVREATGADAVEMESEPIRRLCHERQVPSATIRVISDGATDDLPLDFNRLLTPAHTINYTRLALALALQPAKLLALLRFQQSLKGAAVRLARVLERVTQLVIRDPR